MTRRVSSIAHRLPYADPAEKSGETMQPDQDLFSMVINPLRLDGVFVSYWRASGDWSFAGPRESCAIFHYVAEGTLTIDMEHENSICLKEGDLVIFPHGDAHQIGNSKLAITIPLETVLPSRHIGDFARIKIPGEKISTLFLCAGLHCNAHSGAPLYRLLPKIIVVRKHQIEREPLLRGAIQGLIPSR